jgi:urease subunit alpha
MTSVSHGLSLDDPDQAAMTRERIRPTTMAAEGPLHELGAIQITNSDSQGMGRVGEVLRRTLQLAQVMKPGRGAEHDNERFLRYLAKCTIEPAITHGLSEHVGSLQPGRLADIVLWKPAWLGVKPEVVFKSGFPSWGSYGDGNATLEWSEPRRFRAGWGGKGLAPASVSVTFVSGSLNATDFARKLGSSRTFVTVKHTRGLTRADLYLNKSTAAVEVDPVDGTVTLDGRVLAVPPATDLRLNRSHFLA